MFLDASIISINGTWLIEVVAFIVMVAVLWRYAYPPIQAAAERRQKAIAEAVQLAREAFLLYWPDMEIKDAAPDARTG